MATAAPGESAAAEPAEPDERPVSWTGPRLAGLVLLALGVVCFVAALDVSGGDDPWAISSPRIAPLVSSVLLIVLSLAFLARTVIRPDVELARYAADEMAATHWPTPAALIALLAGYALLLSALGYALSTTVFVWLTAWLLGSDRPVRDLVVGLVIGVVAGLAFTQFLNVQLPTGPWGV